MLGVGPTPGTRKTFPIGESEPPLPLGRVSWAPTPKSQFPVGKKIAIIHQSVPCEFCLVSLDSVVVVFVLVLGLLLLLLLLLLLVVVAVVDNPKHKASF
jgi:hypothetical protein